MCTADYVRTPHFKETIKELKKPKVAFNCVGGDSATELARALGENGILVTYPLLLLFIRYFACRLFSVYRLLLAFFIILFVSFPCCIGGL